ncbi:DMT family transporter [Bradyrhizobium oligotrophicum]|uniref:DMT family transporter n=1 Tax=Bradyrhizobium oligotrophicum TaxID=44255 RepID=UPI003EC08BAF
MNKSLAAHAAAAAAALSAGTAVVATRFVIGETDPISLVFYRYLISVICFAPILPMLWPRAGLDAIAYGKIAGFGILFFVLFPWTFNAALQYNPAARGAVGLATIPIQTLLVATAFGRERLKASKAMGVLLAFSGIAVAFGAAAFARSDGSYLAGDGLMLLSGLCAAISSVFGRSTLMRHGPLFVTALAMAFAVTALAPFVVVKGAGAVLPVFSFRGWMAILFLGSVAGALQFSLYMWALRWLPPTTTTLYLTLNPITAMVLGIALLGERLTLELVVGMMLVLVGILVGSGLHSAWTNSATAKT